MPVATVSTEIVHKELASCEGAFVDLRALPYGKLLHRRDRASMLSMEQQVQTGRRRRQASNEDEKQKLNIETLQTWARQYEFIECIVDHNLEAPDGRKLDFKNKMDFNNLNPKIGSEIEGYIDELNQEEEEDEDDFFSASTTSLAEENPDSTTDGSGKK
jgi:hypothetical protein